jgi:hypothetical protein
MKPKIAYLIDESIGWEDPSWKFYTENEVPYKDYREPGTVKRIVYWEVENDEH